MSTFLAALSCFFFAVILVRLLVMSSVSRSAMDIPNHRSLHNEPVPRIGGLGLLGAVGVGWVIWSPGALSGLVLLAGLLSAITFIDDRAGLPVRTRLVIQTVIGIVFLAVYFQEPFWLLPVAFCSLLWMANLYNFMDGSDGLAGGMTITGFGTYAIAAALTGHEQISVLSACIAGAAAGFLIWNFHRAIVFLGDSGSVPLGFLAAAIGLIGWQKDIWPFWFPFLVFSPFVLDATVTLLKRWSRGENLTQAHKTHYYQRVLRMGLGHRGTAIASYSIMLGSAVTALLGRHQEPIPVTLLLGCWIGVFAGLFTAIDRSWESFLKKTPQG